MLQEQINNLSFIIERINEIPPQELNFANPEMFGTGPALGGREDHPPGGMGDGLAPGYEAPHKKGWKSKEWQEWIKQPGHWHRSNPHKFGSKEFYQWEWDYYEQPPGP